MAEIVKYIYVIIIFLSLFLVATNIEGKLFYRFQISFFYFGHNILLYFCYLILFSFFITTAFFRCKNDFDCVHKRCRGPMRAKCISKAICKCRLAFTLK
ncbi:Nodule Cysteine-Rich (NCR) secreted peptide [Medicago truncatula]|uniref:Nodule Cysteine-Rich (NCR) secreted peptide n=1 Tax=Medicago truncatula TaxID=3880 RepID=A0A072VGB5_MEDTR|nr:Nodule Cysteine-Rich (NCR) secreted peptide [Medicago truncatula]